jgi:hypothetical protein
MPSPWPEDDWERRFVADPARAREVADLYRDAGFEVMALPARPGDLSADQRLAGCESCWLAKASGFQVIYTRRPGLPEDAPPEGDGP